MSYRRFYRRRFLNRPRHHAGAYVLADCSIEDHGNNQHYLDAGLTIADCNRVATLEFPGHDKQALANSLSKARVLRTVVNEFCDALEAAVVEVQARRDGLKN